MNKITYNEENIIKILGEGTESTVYLYQKSDGSFVAFKRFKTSFDDHGKLELIPYSTLENKEKKLEILSKEKCMQDEVKIYDLVYDEDGKFIGYTEEVIDNKKTMSLYFTSFFKREEKLEHLIELKKKKEILNKFKIYIGDYNTDNFIINSDGTIKLIDIENFYVQGLDFDRETNLIKEYKKKSPNIIENVDTYCFNYFTLGYYMSVSPSLVEHYLTDKDLPRKFNTPENRQLREDLKHVGDGKKLGYFIDSTKKGLFH